MTGFNRADILHRLASQLDEGEAGRLRELIALLESAGDEGDWSDDSCLLMSLDSAAMEQEELQFLAPAFAGQAGQLRRKAWDERRATLKREFETTRSGSMG